MRTIKVERSIVIVNCRYYKLLIQVLSYRMVSAQCFPIRKYYFILDFIVSHLCGRRCEIFQVIIAHFGNVCETNANREIFSQFHTMIIIIKKTSNNKTAFRVGNSGTSVTTGNSYASGMCTEIDYILN